MSGTPITGRATRSHERGPPPIFPPASPDGEDEIRERVRRALASGALPPNDGMARSGPGTGRRCAICGNEIAAAETEFEAVSPRPILAHRACYHIWLQESFEDWRALRQTVAAGTRVGARLELLVAAPHGFRLAIGGRPYACAVVSTARHAELGHELPAGSMLAVVWSSSNGNVLATGPCHCSFVLYNFTPAAGGAEP